MQSRRSVAEPDRRVPTAQTELAPFWEGNASVHWNQAANQIARANHLSMSNSNRLLAVLNIAMADTAFTIWSAKRHYGADPAEVTWRPLTAITLADTDGIAETAADPDWLPLVTTPSHPEYPAGHPALNGAAATVLLSHFADVQTFTLTTAGLPSQTYTGISQARADGNNARIWGGMHYPSTVAISDAVGEAIAEYVNANSMQSLRRSATNGSTTPVASMSLGRAFARPSPSRRMESRCRGILVEAYIPAPGRGSSRSRTGRSRGCRGALARRHAGPLRAHDLPPRRRDVLPHLRGGVGGGCRGGLPARRDRARDGSSRRSRRPDPGVGRRDEHA